MRFAPESLHGANAGLAVAREVLEPVKKEFSWITYGDLWTLGGVAAVQVGLNFFWHVDNTHRSLIRKWPAQKSLGALVGSTVPNNTSPQMDVFLTLVKVPTTFAQSVHHPSPLNPLLLTFVVLDFLSHGVFVILFVL